jgi:hypothetical protein
LDPATGCLTAGITVGVQPASIAIGAGYLWETNRDGTISRIEPAANRAVCLLLGRQSFGYGSLWVGQLGSDCPDDSGQVLRMNALTGAVAARIRAGQCTGVTVGDGAGFTGPGRVAIQSAYIHLAMEN